MTLKDAAIVAVVIAFCVWVLNFFAVQEWIIVVADPAAWCFIAIRTYIVAWAGTFVGLAGLHQLIERGASE